MISSQNVALQRCDRFVARTTNWLYDHLRFIDNYKPVILCARLMNRDEFPELEAWSSYPNALLPRIWHKIAKQHVYPSDQRRLRKYQPRILHSHFGSVALKDFQLQRFLDVPWIVSFYGADAYQGTVSALTEKYALLFERATRVLALGPAMKSRLEALGCPAEKISIHALGVDVSSLPVKERILAPGEPIRILFAGTFREKKGVKYLMEGAALARQRGVDLRIELVGDTAGKGGDQETKEEIYATIKSLQLDDVITRHGFLEFNTMLKLALESHVFVAPSVTANSGDAEGTPFVIQQMMATAMPIISTQHSDIPFVFGKQEKLLVPERDAQAIADRLVHYQNCPATLAEDGNNLRKQSLQLDIRQSAAQLGQLYAKLGN